MSIACRSLAAVLCCGLAIVASAQTGTPVTLTNEQLRHFRSIRTPQLSPDGHSVVVVIVDSTAEGGKSHLWLIDTQGAEPRQLTYSPDSDKSGEHDPRWMPDGESILFLAHRGERTKLYRLPMRGGEARAFDLKVHPAADTSKRFDAITAEQLETQETETAESSANKKKSKGKKLEVDPAELSAADVEGSAFPPTEKTLLYSSTIRRLQVRSGRKMQRQTLSGWIMTRMSRGFIC